MYSILVCIVHDYEGTFRLSACTSYAWWCDGEKLCFFSSTWQIAFFTQNLCRLEFCAPEVLHNKLPKVAKEWRCRWSGILLGRLWDSRGKVQAHNNHKVSVLPMDRRGLRSREQYNLVTCPYHHNWCHGRGGFHSLPVGIRSSLWKQVSEEHPQQSWIGFITECWDHGENHIGWFWKSQGQSNGLCNTKAPYVPYVEDMCAKGFGHRDVFMSLTYITQCADLWFELKPYREMWDNHHKDKRIE